MVAGQHDSTTKILSSSQEMLARRLFYRHHSNLLSNNEKEHSPWLKDLKQKRSHLFRKDSLNEMEDAACAINQGNPRGNSNSLLSLTDLIFQNEIAQQLM